MKKVSLTKMSPLRPFQIDVRDKQRVREILFKLEIDTIGWNLPALLEKYCFAVDQSIPRNIIRLKCLPLSRYYYQDLTKTYLTSQLRYFTKTS